MNLSMSDSSENEDDLEERLITEARNKFLKAIRVISFLQILTKNSFIGRILPII